MPELSGDDEDYLNEDDYNPPKWLKEKLRQDEEALPLDYEVTVSV